MQVSLNYVDHLLEKRLTWKENWNIFMKCKKGKYLFGMVGGSHYDWYLRISEEVFQSRGCVYIIYIHIYLIFLLVAEYVYFCGVPFTSMNLTTTHSPLFHLTLTSPLLCTDCYHTFFLKATHLKISVWELITIDN